MTENTSIVRVEPESHVLLNDPVSGGKKIGLVDQTGLGYFDLLGAKEIPKPLFSNLEPLQLPSIPELLGDLEQSSREALTGVWAALTNKDLDPLTIYRGMHWAVVNSAVDSDLVERMALEATQGIVEGRAAVKKGMKLA